MGIKHYIIPIFVPHLGCPHDCVFCNQKKIAGESINIETLKVKHIIDSHLNTFPKNRENFIEVAFFGGSFTAIDRNIQKKLLKVAYEYKNKGFINEIRMSTRPDYIDDDILYMLKEYDVDTVELGVQSMDDEVLYKSGRGHNKNSVYNAVKLLKKHNIKFGLQMMLGLVGDNINNIIYTAKEFIDLKPDCVRVYPTLVIKDTYLERLYLEGNYIPLELKRAIEISTDVLLLFYYNEIDVIRVGLQPTENIQMGKDVIAGPFHASFRQLVESNILKKIIERHFKENSIQDIDLIEFEINKKRVSDLAGQKSCNKLYFMDKFKISKFKIYGTNISLNEIKIKFDEDLIVLDLQKLYGEYLTDKNLI